MKTVEVKIPQELKKQIKTLNSLYNVLLQQKSMLEENKLDNLYETTQRFFKISRIIKKRRERMLDFFVNENGFSLDENDREIDELIDQIGDLMQEIIHVEDYNSKMIEISQQKLGEELKQIY